MVASTERRNEDYPWHEFDPETYLADNYAVLRDEDRQMVELVRDFFAQQFADNPARTGRRGIDVGTGTNLYPALAMLPFVDRLTLYDYSPANIAWLARQRAAHWPSWTGVWSRFWRILSERPSYAHLDGHARAELARCVDVIRGSVFDLDSNGQRWDVGTMFFVAESITQRREEFTAAVNHFINALRPDSPFAVAFMEDSRGYEVAGRSYPSTPVSCAEVWRCLRSRAYDVTVERVDVGDEPLRAGYSGTIVACGRTGPPVPPEVTSEC
ncbi:MAG TPA: SCO2525 family SAM-dependent methyltransferase [Actinophytocola sp.]|uniref:SCO2525 family SAM-dependent methyltransferase n=1 Tax=Actinophytocola sp. TaxID=1872138 RepID=UPI002DBFFE63|nr:SCO2525 family SAM-dependent methyltransferase [Actinophytocola sp.]HEU5469559.1 SCO2525 family SAM-dependent methyltransferase [Actinophytocola sp.]